VGPGIAEEPAGAGASFLFKEIKVSNEVITLLRIVHFTFGAFWLGASATADRFLLPALRAAGAVLLIVVMVFMASARYL
jgi:hypothetical protein